MTVKENVHRLIDELSDSTLVEAERYLEALRRAELEPLWQAFMAAPEDDEPLTAEDIAAIEEGKAEIARGEGIPWEIAREQLRSHD
jgi:hypothetical protein